MKPRFTQSQLESIAAALADTDEGLTGSEITHLLATARINDPIPGITKRHRLYNAFCRQSELAAGSHAHSRFHSSSNKARTVRAAAGPL